jgi:parallel beta-helix repeat protein
MLVLSTMGMLLVHGPATNVSAGPVLPTSFAGGSGAIGDPYIIQNVWELQNISLDGNVHYALGNDIDASITSGWNAGAGFLPINSLAASLDGRNHTISNLYINRPATDNVGVFASLGGIVKNIRLNNVDITGRNDLGGLVGVNGGWILNIHITGTMTGNSQIGCIVGDNYGRISLSSSDVKIAGSANIGGIAGYNNDAAIEGCHAHGTVTGSGVFGSQLGGLVGYMSGGWMNSSYATGSVTGTGMYVGGLIGWNDGSWIRDSYATGDATSVTSQFIGGFIGYNQGSVDNSYSTGSVVGDANLGGFVGYNDGTISDSFWDTQTSGMGTGIGGGTTTGATGRNTAQMKSVSTFTAAGWDFANNWWMLNGQTYPMTKATPVLNVDTGKLFMTIQLGISDAYTLSGHTLQVAGGIYSERLTIQKGIKLVGNGSATTTIQGNATGDVVSVTTAGANGFAMSGFKVTGSGNDANNDAAIYINSANCRLSNLNITGNPGNGIMSLNGFTNSVITNCQFSANPKAYWSQSVSGTGNLIANNTMIGTLTVLAIAASNNFIVRNNTISGGTIGIAISGSSNGNIVEYNTIKSLSTYGISIQNSAGAGNIVRYNTLQSIGNMATRISNSANNNEIYNNTFTQVGTYGIMLQSGANNNLIRGNHLDSASGTSMLIQIADATSYYNTIESNTLNHGQNGVSILNAYANHVLLNKITNSTMYGILVTGATSINNLISSNQVSHSTQNGILSTGSANNNIFHQNNASSNGVSGIRIEYSHHNQITGNFVGWNNNHGIVLSYSYEDTVLSNHLLYNGDKGLRLESTNNTNIQENIAEGNWAGISLSSQSDFNVILDNDLLSNGDAWGGGGIMLDGSDNNEIHNNTATGIEFIGIWLSESDENDIAGNVLQGGKTGIRAVTSWSNVIRSNTINNTADGIIVSNSVYTSVEGNDILNSSWNGITLDTSAYCQVNANTVFQSSQYGIRAQTSSDSWISWNTVSKTHSGIAVELDSSSDIIISHNFLTLSNNQAINLLNSDSNIIESNDIYDNAFGVEIDSTSDNNSIFKNVFEFQMGAHGYDRGVNNHWDLGYPGGGNYWDDWHSPDVKRGVNQDIAGADGFVDSPRAIMGSAGAQDNYPWVDRIMIYEYKITDLLMYPSVDVQYQVGETVWVSAVLWDGDLGLQVPQAGVDIEFDFYGWPPNGAASFNGPSTVATDSDGMASIEFIHGDGIGDHWKVTAMNDTIGIYNESHWIEVVAYRGDLAIFDEGQMNWSVLSEHEDTPVKQIVEKGVARSGTARFLALVANTGSVNDTITFSWDNSSFPAGWELAITEIEDVNVDPENWIETNVSVAVGYIDLLMEPNEARFFLFYVTTSESSAYGDIGEVLISVRDYANQWDRGILRASIPIPDAMYMVIGDTEAEVLGGETHPVPISDFLADFMLPVNTELPPFWGVLYNETTGLPMEIAGVHWEVTNMGGASAFMNITSGTDAESITLNSGPAQGQVTIKASYLDPISGAWWNDTWNFNVTSGWDSVNITYTPGGEEVPDRMVTVGDELELWASVYNSTAGYITTTVMADWNGTGPVEQIAWYQEGGVKVRFTDVGYVWVNVSLDMDGKNITDSVLFQVVGPLHHVRIEMLGGSLPAATYNADATTTLYLRGYDEYGTLLGDYNGNWNLDGDNATLSSATGTSVTVTWNKVGFVNLTAQFGGLTDTRMFSVTNGAVATITVTPTGDTITADETKQFTAVCRDADGNIVPGQVIIWSSTNGNITGGLFTPWSATTVTITATVGAVSGNATITVTPGVAQSIIITPSAAGIEVGQSVNFTAEARDAKGNLVTTSFLWDAENGTITAEGVYTAMYAGTWNITASAGNATGHASVIVAGSAVVDTISPVANAGADQIVNAGTVVRFNGSASTDNVGVTNYTWTFTFDGTARALYGQAPTFTFTIAGNYTVTLTVRDAAGNTGTDTMVVRVISVTPVIIGPVLDPEGNPIPGANVTVVIGDNTYYGTTNETGYAVIDIPDSDLGGFANVTVVADGFDTVDYTAILDTDGTPSAQPPPMNDSTTPADTTAPAANAGTDQTAVSGTLITFDGSSSTDNIGITNYTWAFTYNGTAITLYGASPSFRFWTPGTYAVSLTVRDAAGNADTDVVQIKVTSEDEGGPANFTWIILIIVIVAIIGIVAFMMMGKGKAPLPKGEAPEEAVPEESVPEEAVTEPEAPAKQDAVEPESPAPQTEDSLEDLKL